MSMRPFDKIVRNDFGQPKAGPGGESIRMIRVIAHEPPFKSRTYINKRIIFFNELPYSYQLNIKYWQYATH